MSHLHEPAASSDRADLIFRRAPWLGWTVTTDDDEPLLIPLVWFRDGRPIDWQGGRKIVEDTIWGSGRVLRQDGGAQPLTLTTNAVFRNKATFQRFWRYQERQGTVTMNAAWTMHAPDRTIHKHGVDYAMFDDVTILSPGALTFDLGRRPMLEGITFSREDLSWS